MDDMEYEENEMDVGEEEIDDIEPQDDAFDDEEGGEGGNGEENIQLLDESEKQPNMRTY